jgi:hypothetical protein
MPEPELEFQIIAAEPEPVYQEPELVVYHPPRKPRELKAPPAPSKTLTPEQLKEANRILHAEGDVAMTTYLNHCREGFVLATPGLAIERSVEPFVAPKNLVPARHKDNPEDEMANMLERARQELQETMTRLQSYEAEIVALKSKQEFDTERQLKLEAYIAKHEDLANEAAQLLELLPPPPAPIALPTPSLVAPSKTRAVRGPYKARATRQTAYGMPEIAAKILPLLRTQGKQQFRAGDVLELILASDLPLPAPTLENVGGWLHSYTKKGDTQIVKSPAIGFFAFRDTVTPASPLAHAPVEQVAYA